MKLPGNFHSYLTRYRIPAILGTSSELQTGLELITSFALLIVLIASIRKSCSHQWVQSCGSEFIIPGWEFFCKNLPNCLNLEYTELFPRLRIYIRQIFYQRVSSSWAMNQKESQVNFYPSSGKGFPFLASFIVQGKSIH